MNWDAPAKFGRFENLTPLSFTIRWMKLEGKVAIVTGGSRGIGKAVAKTFAREGARVVVNYVRASAEARRVVEEIRTAGGSAVSVMADVSQRDQAQRLVDETVKTFGRVDILVNNAGIRSEGTVLDTTEEDWDRTMNVNLKGPFNCMQAAGKVMAKQRYGKMVNVSSISGLGGAPGERLAYCASKAGLINMTMVASLDLRSVRNQRQLRRAGLDHYRHGSAGGGKREEAEGDKPDKGKHGVDG